jgi:hypothetical protein
MVTAAFRTVGIGIIRSWDRAGSFCPREHLPAAAENKVESENVVREKNPVWVLRRHDVAEFNTD